MPVPLALAAPAAVAGLAYLNAKTSFWYDTMMFRMTAVTVYRIAMSQRKNRINLFYTLESLARSPRTASRRVLWYEGRWFTYAEFHDHVLRYGNWLHTKHGVQPGNVVAMDMQNSTNFVFVWWALWAIGAKPAFINYNLTDKPLSHCIKIVKTKLCIIDSDLASNITDALRQENEDTKFVIMTPAEEAEATHSDPVRYPDATRNVNEPWDPAILIFTSGTTGLPKPGIMSWARTIAGATTAHILMARGGADDILYTPMPLYHGSACVLSFTNSVLSGTATALGHKFSTKTFWNEARASNATSIQYVGETLRYLLAAPPQYDPVSGECLDREHHIRMAFGNGLRPDVWGRFKERFGIPTIAEFYTSTEAPLGLWNRSSNDFADGAIGRRGMIYSHMARSQYGVVEVDWDVEAPRRDPNTGFCIRVPDGEPGELICNLPVEGYNKRYQGYYGNKRASDAKLMHDVFQKGDLWFRTGDVIRWGQDGLFYFHDRIGDTYRWKSENVSTAEVSELVGTHPAVREANVYGVELPHHDGRAGCAAVWMDAADVDTMRSLARHVKATLPRYAQPLFLRVKTGSEHSEAHLTGTNKQQKQALREAGVKPAGGDADTMGALYWLQGDEYVPFCDQQWREIEGGRVKL